MKAIFITYGQALTEQIEDILDNLRLRGFTRWEETYGRGNFRGEPHLGTHVWPAKNTSTLCIIPDEKVNPLLDALKKLNQQAEQQGLNAFVWNIENSMFE